MERRAVARFRIAHVENDVKGKDRLGCCIVLLVLKRKMGSKEYGRKGWADVMDAGEDKGIDVGQVGASVRDQRGE
jgi:hypothetical protein